MSDIALERATAIAVSRSRRRRPRADRRRLGARSPDATARPAPRTSTSRSSACLRTALRSLLESLGRVEAVGESFQVYKIGDIDVSLPRRESKSGRGHRGFDVAGDPSMTFAEAARRRDFTINAIALGSAER